MFNHMNPIRHVKRPHPEIVEESILQFRENIRSDDGIIYTGALFWCDRFCLVFISILL